MSKLAPIVLILVVIGILGSIGTAMSLLNLIEFGTPEINETEPPSALETGYKVADIIKLAIPIIFGCVVFVAIMGVLSKLR